MPQLVEPANLPPAPFVRLSMIHHVDSLRDLAAKLQHLHFQSERGGDEMAEE